MHFATIYIDPKGAVPVGFSQAAGLPGDIKFEFKTQGNLAYPGIANLYPQLVLRPFTRTSVFAFDIAINDPTGASGIAVVPEEIMIDRHSVEVYTRNADKKPQRMIATGRIDLTGYAYTHSGPLGPIDYEPPDDGDGGGTPGPPGERGSRWYTGPGAPATVPDTRVEGDMWLDETTGDVWRWDAATTMWASVGPGKV